jgi:hypothetical protein
MHENYRRVATYMTAFQGRWPRLFRKRGLAVIATRGMFQLGGGAWDARSLGGEIEGDDGGCHRHLFRWSKALLARRFLRHRPFPVLHVALRHHLVRVLRVPLHVGEEGGPRLRRAHHLQPRKQISIHPIYLGSFRFVIVLYDQSIKGWSH